MISNEMLTNSIANGTQCCDCGCCCFYSRNVDAPTYYTIKGNKNEIAFRTHRTHSVYNSEHENERTAHDF